MSSNDRFGYDPRKGRGDGNVRGIDHNALLGKLSGDLMKGAILLAIVVIAFFLYTCFYRVDASDQGVVLRFGKHVRTVETGLQMKLPWPIESVYTVPVKRVQSKEFGFQTVEPGRKTIYAKQTKRDEDIADMLTGDLNLAHVEWIVQYRISDPYKSLFNLGGDDSGLWSTNIQKITQNGINPAIPDTIQDVSETVMRRQVGDRSVDAVLTLGREEIAAKAKIDIQAMLDEFDAGVDIVMVKLQTTSPPDPVKDAFQEVNRARQNKERVVNEAEGERNRQIPAAEGRRDQLISEAEGYKSNVTQETVGLISAFNAKLAEYDKAPEVTRQRLYLEAMQEVLGNVGGKTIVDESLNQMLPILNLNNGGSANPLRGNK